MHVSQQVTASPAHVTLCCPTLYWDFLFGRSG